MRSLCRAGIEEDEENSPDGRGKQHARFSDGKGRGEKRREG